MQTQTNFAGIDISKLSFDVAFIKSGRPVHYKLSNEINGFKTLLEILPANSQVVMEASGPYYLRLACFLYDAGIKLSVVNPLIIRRFCQMRMCRAKTDKKDAMMIAEYGSLERPCLWQKPEQHVITLQQIQALLTRLQAERTALSNQLESFVSGGMLTGGLKKQIHAELAHKDRMIEKLNQEMEQITRQHYAQMLTNLESIPGMGRKTAMSLIVLSGGFTRFEDYRKLSSYIGICPRIFESGTSVKGKARICKMGMSHIRALLYLCSWSASRCNKACRELYQRLLAKGKAKKLALIAVANKLLKQAFAIATQKTKYHENYSNIPCF